MFSRAEARGALPFVADLGALAPLVGGVDGAEPECEGGRPDDAACVDEG